MQLNKIKGLQMKTFSEKFEQNANLQLRKVTRAIDLYVKNVYIKSRLIRYVSSQAGFGMMQPLALKNFSDVVYSYLEPIIGSDNISMFTVVVDKYNFGQDNWNFQYKSFQKKIKKIFKGYNYIANVALDEFPRIRHKVNVKISFFIVESFVLVVRQHISNITQSKDTRC